MIAILDYGMGNQKSVANAFQYLGFEAQITEDAMTIEQADKLILPGVGAFQAAMAALNRKGFENLIQSAVRQKKPLLGICLGMQILFEKGYEYGEQKGLGLLPGAIVKLPENVKIPHVGWNSLEMQKESALFTGLSGEPYVYFVHSYHLETNADIVSATCHYGKTIQVAAEKDNVFGVQFHPEKSGDIGLQILQNFGRM